MGRYNEILVGRFNRFLQKLLGMKGPASMAQLASDLQPTLAFDVGNEGAYLQSWNLFSFTALVAAQGAGNQGALRLRNPTGSNVIALVTKAFFYDNVNLVQQKYQIVYGHTAGGVDQNDLGTVEATAGFNWDTRGGGPLGQVGSSLVLTAGAVTTVPAFVTWSGVANAGSSANAYIEALTLESQYLPLLPGDTLTFKSNIANNSFTTGIFWRERFLEDSERT
jgi:hypothetical protein